MKVVDKENRPVIWQTLGPINHTIDDDENNVLASPHLLVVREQGDIKVKHANGEVETIEDFFNQTAHLVIKIYSTGTTVSQSKIKLYE